MRWIITGIILGLLAAGIGALATRPGSSPDPNQGKFLQWETCTLNGQPRCGPMPTP